MKVKTANISVIDMSDAEKCEVALDKLPSKEEIIAKVKKTLEALREKGVVEIEELNITLLDLSGAENIKLK